jgi:hypothetical protein
MAYTYRFDDRFLGDFEFTRSAYGLIQDALKALRAEVKKWNGLATQHGAKVAPYAEEQQRLENMIDFGSTKLAEQGPWVPINGMSVGSARFLKAGLELAIRHRRAELQKNRAAGWPSGALQSLEASIQELEKLAKTIEVEPAEILWEVMPREDVEEIVVQVRAEERAALWDAFVSHASEDSAVFARPLAQALRDAGLRIWYDEFALKVGDSLRRSIDRGLSRSRYGIVVLSPSCFAKEWPQKELDGLIAREIDGTKVILPVWHDILMPRESGDSHPPWLTGRQRDRATAWMLWFAGYTVDWRKADSDFHRALHISYPSGNGRAQMQQVYRRVAPS